jgi:hypothetical protein
MNLMSNKLSAQQRIDFMQEMKANRQVFQLILEAAAQGSLANLKSRQTTPAATRSAGAGASRGRGRGRGRG